MWAPVVMRTFSIVLLAHQYPGCGVCCLLLGKTGQRGCGILYYFSQLQVNLQLPQKKKENAYGYHKKTEVEVEKKACLINVL